MSIHIGGIIDRIAYDKRLSRADLAKKAEVHPAALSPLLQKADMKSSVIRRFSLALDTDLFAYFSNDLKSKKEMANAIPQKTECEKLLDESLKEVEKLKKEIEYLKKINELLERK